MSALYVVRTFATSYGLDDLASAWVSALADPSHDLNDSLSSISRQSGCSFDNVRKARSLSRSLRALLLATHVALA